jgi:hypothetical protein
MLSKRESRLADLAARFSNVGIGAHAPRWLFDQLTRPAATLSTGEAAHRLMIGEAIAAGDVPDLLDALRAHATHAQGMRRAGLDDNADAAGLTPDLCAAFWDSPRHELESLIESAAIRPAPDHARLFVLAFGYMRASFREAWGAPVLPDDIEWADGVLESASDEASEASQAEIELAGAISQRADSARRPMYLAG